MDHQENINGEVIAGLLTRPEAAKYLGVSTRTIDRYIAQNKISVVREDGHVLLREDELYHILQEKNPVATQVVHQKSHLSPSTELQIHPEQKKELEKYKVLYDEAREGIEQRDEMIRQMHYRLGVLETEAKGQVPLLEAETTKQELALNISTLTEEKKDLEERLDQTQKARSVFFVVSIILLFLLFVFVLIQSQMS